MSKAQRCPCGRPLGKHARKISHIWRCFTCSLRYPGESALHPPSNRDIARCITFGQIARERRHKPVLLGKVPFAHRRRSVVGHALYTPEAVANAARKHK